ncbi:MAG: alpha-2-macroglobulin family protein, partial [Planctomycetota bacterium]
ALELTLPDTMVGRRDCELRLEKEAGAEDVRLTTTRLYVAEPERALVSVALDAPAAPLERGSAAQVRLRLTDGYGEPIANERAQVSVAGGEPAEHDTGAMGFVTVAVPAEATTQDGLHLTVRIRGERLQARDLTVRATGALVDGIPGVAGEPYAIPVELRRGDRPAAGVKLQATVWRPDPVTAWKRAGEPAELVSDADGNVTWTVQPSEGGDHRLRLEWTDRHGIPARAEWGLAVAGAGDPGKVRIVAPALKQTAGATVQLRLVSDLPAGTAWVAVHGDQLWSARRIAVAKGITPFEVTLPPAPHRNARVTCIVEHDGELWQPEVRFRIAHALTVTCTAPEGAQRPGATVPVRVQLAGPGGTPVAGHVTLLVQESADGRAARRAVGDLPQRFVPDSGRSFLRFGLSAAYRPPATVEARDAAIDQALAELTAAANRAHGPVMVEQVPLDEMVRQRALPGAFQGKYWNDSIGVGGGAGGQFGGRFGGKRDLVARGGGGRGGRGWSRVPRPPLLVRGALRAGADGAVTVDVPLPLRRGTYEVTVVAASGATLFGSGHAQLEVGGDLAVELTLPPRLRASDRSAIRVRLQNRGTAERTVTLRADRTSGGAAAGAATQVTLAAGAAQEAAVVFPPLLPGSNTLRISIDGGDGAAFTAERRVTLAADDPTAPAGAAGAATGP